MSKATDHPTIEPELLLGKAEEQAKLFHKPGNKEKKLSSSQLRRFYSDFKRLETKYKNGQDFESILPLIKMQISKSAYAANPERPKIPQTFHRFIETNVKNIQTPNDFERFMLHFEAVVGFFYWNEGHGVKDN